MPADIRQQSEWREREREPGEFEEEICLDYYNMHMLAIAMAGQTFTHSTCVSRTSRSINIYPTRERLAAATPTALIIG